jgi:uncharacterized protein YbjQ (UPF0145 family)
VSDLGPANDPGMIRDPIPITTAFDFPGWEVERWVGPCFGLIVRSMGFGNTFKAGFRSLAKTEMVEYTRLLEDSRREAIDRLVGHAMALGANGIVGMRFDSSEIGGQFTEIVAYGTGVIVRAPSAPPPGPPTA